MEKKLKKNIKLNHFPVHLKLTQHCKSTIPQSKNNKNKKRDHTVFVCLCLTYFFLKVGHAKIYLFIYLATTSSLQDLSSLTRD